MRSISHFALPRILPPRHMLAVHGKLFQLSHLAPGKHGPRLLRVVHLDEAEIRVLTPLLRAYPAHCPYEVILASHAGEPLDDLTLVRHRRRLAEAKDEVLAPVRAVLTALNKKRGLRTLNMKVCGLQGVGYFLIPLAAKKLSVVRPGDAPHARPSHAPGASKQGGRGRASLHLVRV